eukprot:1435940-Prymnesium_polylepis.1
MALESGARWLRARETDTRRRCRAPPLPRAAVAARPRCTLGALAVPRAAYAPSTAREQRAPAASASACERAPPATARAGGPGRWPAHRAGVGGRRGLAGRRRG